MYQYRGGGGIHVTGIGNYEEVKIKELNNIKKSLDAVDGDDMSDTASETEDNTILCTEYIAYNYPWLSAGIYGDMNNINDKLRKGGIYRVTAVVQPRAADDCKLARRTLYEKCKKLLKSPQLNALNKIITLAAIRGILTLILILVINIYIPMPIIVHAEEASTYRILTKRYACRPDGYHVLIEWPKITGAGNQQIYDTINYILEREIFRDVGGVFCIRKNLTMFYKELQI